MILTFFSFCTDMECAICIEHFNKTTHKKITCLYCHHETCHKCVEKYLLENTISPQCMSCKREWNMEFIRANLSRTFMDKKYKEHQKGAILAEAESRLANYQEYTQLQIEYEKANAQLLEARRRMQEAQRQHWRCIDKLKAIGDRMRGTTIPSTEERRTFFMACPDHECRGRLSTGYKCGMCDKSFCSHCHQRKDTDHVCNQDDVETVKMLRQNTKPCPKCHVGIFKTEGCDQMWCTQCHTCFSWTTGNILHGVLVHNPHFYEHQRNVGAGHAPRVAGDVVCGGMPTYTEILRRQPVFKTHDDVQLTKLHRYANELEDMVMPSIRRKFRDGENKEREYGAQFLRNKITRIQWIELLFKRSRQEEKYRRYYQVLETLHANIAEYMRQYIRGESASTVMQSCQELFKCANEECAIMRKQYNMSIPVLKF